MPGLPNLNSAEITKNAGSNLALSFFALSKEKQRAMTIFYAFCRIADDIVDEKERTTESKQAEINLWRKEIENCYAGIAESSLGKELQEIINEFLIPPEPFFELLNGVEMDLVQDRYETFEDLRKYCYRVASAVGLASICIFGYRHPRTQEFAIHLGLAFQLTNILRDVGYDLREYGRVYLPQEEMRAFGVTDDDFKNQTNLDKCRKLFRLQFFRALHHFNKAKRLLAEIDEPNMIAPKIMTEVYYNVLLKIRDQNFDVLPRQIRHNKIQKIGFILKALWKHKQPKISLLPPQHIAILGGGFSGVSTALHLASEGHDIELFEARPALGGRAYSFKDPQSQTILDNGQHIFMGCYKSCMRLFDLLGIQDKLQKQPVIDVPFHSVEKGLTELKASTLPAPFHLLSALFGYKELSCIDRLSILWLGTLLRLGHKPSKDWTVSQWMEKTFQSQNAIRSLWEPLCIAALNEPIVTADALLFYEVLSRSLFGGKEDASIYISKVGLSDFLSPEVDLFLKSVGSKIHFKENVQKIQFEHGKVVSIDTSEQKDLVFDTYISSLPWHTLRKFLPEDHSFTHQIGKIEGAPIFNLHLFYDKAWMKPEFVGLLDSPVQWIFDRSSVLHADSKFKHHYSIVMSAAYGLLEKSTQEVVDLVQSEIEKHFPDAKSATLQHSFLYKSKDATFAARPETESLRPHSTTPWKNFFVVGDWVQTQLPATLESAVLSGEKMKKLLNTQKS